jgi:iron-sulfur cluster assembly accessory protein
MSLTPAAVSQLKELLASPTPQMIRVGVKNRGCSGLSYHLEYVDKPGKFDEEVVQDGVKVLIDSKALFSIIGSEMDWVEDKLAAKFVFKNPNISEYPTFASPLLTSSAKQDMTRNSRSSSYYGEVEALLLDYKEQG